MSRKLDALIVHPNTDRRSQLRLLAQTLPQYGSVNAIGSTTDALDALHHNPDLRIVFVSYELGPYGVSSFILRAKETPIGRHCAFIVIFENDKHNGVAFANNLLSGADGLLIEPFSAATLDEITSIACNVQEQSQSYRCKIASRLLIATIMAEIDRRSDQIAKGKKPQPLSPQVKQACKLFRELSGNSMLTYFETLFDTFEEAADDLEQRAETPIKSKRRAQIVSREELNVESVSQKLAANSLSSEESALVQE